MGKPYQNLFFNIYVLDQKYTLELYDLSTQSLFWSTLDLGPTQCTILLNLIKQNLIFTVDDLSANFLSNLTSILQELTYCTKDIQQSLAQEKIHSLSQQKRVPSHRACSYALADVGSGFSGYLSDQVWSFRVTGTLNTPSNLSKLNFISSQKQHIELVSYFYENQHLISKPLYSLSKNEMLELYFKPKMRRKIKSQYTLVPEVAMRFNSESLINMQNQILNHTFTDNINTGFDRYISENFNNLTFQNLTYSMSSGGLHSRDTGEIACRKSQGHKFGILDLTAAYPTALVYLSRCSTLLHGTTFKDCESQFTQLLQDRLNAKDGDWIQGKKLILNSIIGSFKYPRSALYEPYLNVNITTFVQLLLLKTIELIYESICNDAFKIVFANTDGIGILYKSEATWETLQKILNTFISEYGMRFTYESHDYLYFRNINNYFTNLTFKGAYTSPSSGCFKSIMTPRIIMKNLMGYMEHVEYQGSVDLEDYIFLRNNKLYVYVEGSAVEFTSKCSLQDVDKLYYRTLYDKERQRIDRAVRYTNTHTDVKGNQDKLYYTPEIKVFIEKYLESSFIGRFSSDSTKFLYENYKERIRLLDRFGRYFRGDVLSRYDLKNTCKSRPNHKVGGISLYADQHMYIVDIDDPTSLPPRLVEILENSRTLVSIKQRTDVTFHPSRRTRWFFFAQKPIVKVDNTKNKTHGFEILWNKAGRVIGNINSPVAPPVLYFCNNTLISNNVELEIYLSELGYLKFTGIISQNNQPQPLSTIEAQYIKSFLEKTMDIKTPITYKNGHLFTVCYGSDLHTDKKPSQMCTYKNSRGMIKFTCFHVSCTAKLKRLSTLLFVSMKNRGML